MVALCVFMALWLIHSEQETTVPLTTLSALIWLVCGRVPGVEIKENWNVVPLNVSDGVVPSLATVRVTLCTISWESEISHRRKSTSFDVHTITSCSVGHNSTLFGERINTPIVQYENNIKCTEVNELLHVGSTLNLGSGIITLQWKRTI